MAMYWRSFTDPAATAVFYDGVRGWRRAEIADRQRSPAPASHAIAAHRHAELAISALAIRAAAEQMAETLLSCITPRNESAKRLHQFASSLVAAER